MFLNPFSGNFRFMATNEVFIAIRLYKLVLTVAIMAVFAVVVACCSEKEGIQPIDLTPISAADGNWEVVSSSVDAAQGSITLHNKKWLMYFLHWRPLVDSNRSVTFEYVKNHLLNFWGPAMPFTLSGKEGELEIAGHRALYVEATLGPNKIRTRFLVWNCEETNRQFTADCNINLLMKTPAELFDIQEDITRTICCHGQESKHDNPDLPWIYQNDSLNISFSKPVNWHTSTFMASTWFPEGQTSTNGTLWTLISDSEKRVQLWWHPTTMPASKLLLDSLLLSLPTDSTFAPADPATVKISVESTNSRNGMIEGIGYYLITEVENNQSYNDKYLFRSLLWQQEGISYLLLTSMLAYDEIWMRPFDLVPSDSMMEHLLWKEIAPHVRPLPEHYKQ
ncbi:MAG: hypothetical protein GY855_10315 [candidate division Zixibacteria bacterium]|nr:hypothetical protein [candidate division Zixibacteria bacterium]